MYESDIGYNAVTDSLVMGGEELHYGLNSITNSRITMRSMRMFHDVNVNVECLMLLIDQISLTDHFKTRGFNPSGVSFDERVANAITWFPFEEYELK